MPRRLASVWTQSAGAAGGDEYVGGGDQVSGGDHALHAAVLHSHVLGSHAGADAHPLRWELAAEPLHQGRQLVGADVTDPGRQQGHADRLGVLDQFGHGQWVAAVRRPRRAQAQEGLVDIGDELVDAGSHQLGTEATGAASCQASPSSTEMSRVRAESSPARAKLTYAARPTGR